MQAVMLTSGSTANPGWHARDLLRAAADVGCALQVRPWRQLVGRVALAASPASAVMAGDLDLAGADLVLPRTMGPGSLEQIVLRMDLLQRLEAQGVAVLNRPRAVEAAVDKYLTLAKLAAAGLPTPPTIACQTLPDALAAFDQLGRDVVVKPLFGSEGFGLARLTDVDLAARAFAQLERMNAVIYLQRYIDHGGHDDRLLVLDGQVLTAMRRHHPTDWRTNIARGAQGQPHRPTDSQQALALAAADACGAFIAGVDVMTDRDGQAWVIEVNAVPGWRALSAVTGVDVAGAFLTQAMRHVEARRGASCLS